MAHFPKWEFFSESLLMSLLSFMPIYMPKIKVRYLSISEILTIKEYWNLIGREPFLAITWEPDFSQACSFRRMLMNHKNFCFTQIPDKTNDMIFLKSPKTMFLGHFWPFFGHFCPMVILSHTTIYGLLTHVKFQKKLMSQSRENLRTDGRTDGRDLFYKTLPAEAGGPIMVTTLGMPRCTWQNQNKWTESYRCNYLCHM